MPLRSSGLNVVLASVILAGAAVAACGANDGVSVFDTNGTDSGTGGGIDATVPGLGLGDGGTPGIGPGGDGSTTAGFDVSPAAVMTITVPFGAKTPTVAFTATSSGSPVNVAWSLDRGDAGSIAVGPSSTGTFVPSGSVGGVVTITAGYNGKTITRQIVVKVTGKANGANAASPAEAQQIPANAAALTAGGGVGGVGGEGLGGAVTDAPTLAALAAAPTSDGTAQKLAFLYPYDRTVFPRGLLAPLLQWDWSTGDADAIQISLSTTSGAFAWTGTFGRPAILGAGKFTRHPIPQDVWDAATNTAGGKTAAGAVDKLTVSLTVVKKTGATAAAYGPISETWTIAPARLSGTIYYQSYGTQLAQNYPAVGGGDGAVGGNHRFGGAVLSIHVGDTAPKLVAGFNSNDTSGCRVCHSVAADGSHLIAQWENRSTSSLYGIKTGAAATDTPLKETLVFPGLDRAGTLALGPDGTLVSLPTDTKVATTGLAAYADLGTPAFSPDGTHVVINPSSALTQLLVLDFDKATSAFSNPTPVVNAGRPGWGAFFPDGKAIAYHQQLKTGLDGDSTQMFTRKGAQAQIAWTSTTDATKATTLNQLNGLDAAGKSYLPRLGSATMPASTLACNADGAVVGAGATKIDPSVDHALDANLNYEPTVNPVASGGYVWVVFTSRRMYGSVADIPPYCSDPRGVDLVSNITTKKLWVAAVDLGAAPGTDASHPAFYLPAQEILAGNARAFWALDPCLGDGTSCATGDQCCNGYCEANGDGGALVCSNTPPTSRCSATQDKCAVTSDCCLSTDSCVNGFCAQSAPR